METSDIVDVFDVERTKLSDKWIDFLSNAQVDCPIDVTAATAPDKYPSLKCSQNRFWNLTFSTTENKSRFITAGTTGIFEPDGYTISGNAILGLPSPKKPVDTQSQTAYPLKDVLAKFGVVLPETGLVKFIIDALVAAEIELKIDYSEPRSALWLVGISCTTELPHFSDLGDKARRLQIFFANLNQLQ
jgi:hypothetical protein